MKFMMMMHAPRGTGDWNIADWSPEDLQAHIAFMMRFNQDLQDSGAFVGAQGLAPPGQARIVRSRSGATEVTDGPFAETKEFLAGYWIIEVASPEQAYDLAARASAAPGPGGKPLEMAIEVREVTCAPEV